MDFIVAYPTNTIAAGLFALLICFHFLSSKLRTPKNKPSPPEASGAWPVIGHLHLLGGPQLPHITLGNMADKFGPIFTIRLGTSRALVASSWEIAKELFTTFDIAVSSRPKFIAAAHLGYNYAMFGFSPYGPYWRELRKITSIELLSTRRIELLKHVRLSETRTSIKELYKVWKENKEGGGVVVEMKQWFGDLSFNVILRMIAGKRYFGSGGGDSAGEEVEARRCQKVMRDFFYYNGLFLVSDSLPFLRFLDLGGHEKAMKKCGKEMDQMIGRWVDEHQRNNDLGVVVGEKDFIDVMLSVVGSKDFGGFDGVTVTKATCMSLLSGGSDTSMVMLTWTLSILLNNPHALRKAQEELDHHIGKERTVDESDLNNLVYLEAIIKETLRLYPAGALTLREFIEDCTVGGYHVPKGTRLIMNMWKLQRDPRVWPNPLEFKPERFLTTHKNVDVTGQHFELIPFGAGRRSCPGITFGLQLLRLVLATLLHGFDIFTPNDTPIDMTESAGLTNIKATPLEVLLSPRLSPHLY